MAGSERGNFLPCGTSDWYAYECSICVFLFTAATGLARAGIGGGGSPRGGRDPFGRWGVGPVSPMHARRQQDYVPPCMEMLRSVFMSVAAGVGEGRGGGSDSLARAGT